MRCVVRVKRRGKSSPLLSWYRRLYAWWVERSCIPAL